MERKILLFLAKIYSLHTRSTFGAAWSLGTRSDDRRRKLFHSRSAKKTMLSFKFPTRLRSRQKQLWFLDAVYFSNEVRIGWAKGAALSSVRTHVWQTDCDLVTVSLAHPCRVVDPDIIVSAFFLILVLFFSLFVVRKEQSTRKKGQSQISWGRWWRRKRRGR